MKKFDFLILLDGKQRELESVCLLRYGLERHGYTVKILPQSTWYYLSHRIPTYDCNVLIIPWGYNDDTMIFALRYVRNFKKIVNLQWEQFWDLADDSNSNHFGFISGWARQCVHVSWGPKNANKLINQCGISERNIIKAGQLSFDFLRNEFNGFYMDRKTLFSRYGLPQDKTVLLFVSSFYYTSVPIDVVPGGDSYTTISKNTIINTSIRVKDLTLQLFVKLLDRHKDIVIIYRLHPVEWGCDKVLSMNQKYENFRLIADLSLKQWIKVVDKIYLWQSMSMAEAVFAGKPCYNIGLNDMEFGMRSPLLEHSRYIDNYEDFEKSVLENNVPSTVDECALKERYGFITDDIPCYVKLCEGLEKVYRDSSYDLPVEFENSIRRIKTPKDKLRLRMKKSIIYDVAFFLAKKTKLKWKVLQCIRNRIAPFETEYYKEIQKRFWISPKEIDDLVRKISETLNND